ncbi:sugar-binding transcriptional regulator, partial [Klebsiella pneumoniae]|nr:sugar-binding transcriptional regulator [Klebsiella pneumoniae]MBL2612115.1 sugar-binding transcriptional regulator [Klebsiella pneumoniae]MBL3096709.1 sugar-binding transcriptional regulator [Klebsiella pneumoniae]
MALIGLYQINSTNPRFAQMCRSLQMTMENSDDIRLIVKIAQLYY